VSALAESAAYVGLATTIVQGVIYVVRKRADDESKSDEWMRDLVDEQIAKREAERKDCTEQIRHLTTRLDASDERADAIQSQLDDCHDQHATAIAARHATHRELTDIRTKYTELRGIVDVISERPPSSPAMEAVK
jgi:chromosome segregation ATPase